jgi:hypothetical protein
MFVICALSFNPIDDQMLFFLVLQYFNFLLTTKPQSYATVFGKVRALMDSYRNVALLNYRTKI